MMEELRRNGPAQPQCQDLLPEPSVQGLRRTAALQRQSLRHLLRGWTVAKRLPLGPQHQQECHH